MKGNSTVDTVKSNTNAPIRPDTQSDSTVLKYPPTVCVSDATDTNANSTCNYFQDSSCDLSKDVHQSVINVPVSNRFKALHDDRVNSDLTLHCMILTVVGWLVLLLYVPSQQLWSLRDGQFT